MEYLEQKIRAMVKAKPNSGGYKKGAYVTVPKAWRGKTVRVSLEESPDHEAIERIAVGSTNFSVSSPSEWIGKTVIVELIRKNQKVVKGTLDKKKLKKK